MTDKDLTAPEAVERLAKYHDWRDDGESKTADTLRALSAERDALNAELAEAVEGLINEAVSMADDNDEKAYVEKRLRAFIARHQKEAGV